MTVRIAEKGETVFDIAAEYGVDPYILAFNNDIADYGKLAVGQPLLIVFPAETHTVMKDETLTGIALGSGVSVKTLWQNNLFLNGQDAVFPGQTLYIRVNRTPIGGYMTGGYAYPFIGDTLLCRTLPHMSCLMPFTYGFRPDGTLISPNDARLIAHSKTYGTAPVMHLSTLTEEDTFSVALAEKLFSSVELQETLIANILVNMRDKGYTALDVDFEFLGKKNAVAYAEFITRCRLKLNPNGYAVLVALAPKTYDTQPGALYEGHDYALLGQAANTVLLMTYEWGYSYGPPMAVSPIMPVKRVIDYAITRIAPEKIFLGISNYGYDFVLPYVQGVSKAQSLSTRQAFSLAAERGATIVYDETAQAPNFVYYEGTEKHIVWFEDGRSIESRLKLMAYYGLRGALYWNLNRENNQNLVVINGLINLKKSDLF